jgi:hypothetical protein
MTHKTSAFDPEIGAEMVRRLIDRDRVSDETVLRHHILTDDISGATCVVNKNWVNYSHRSDFLSVLPRVLYDMWYHPRALSSSEELPPADRDRHPFRFREDHPLATTWVIAERQKYNFEIPRFFCSTPTRPLPDAATAVSEAYATFKLGNFVSDRVVEALLGATAWERMLAWEADASRDGPLTEIVERMLAHLESAQRAQDRARARRKLK